MPMRRKDAGVVERLNAQTGEAAVAVVEAADAAQPTAMRFKFFFGMCIHQIENLSAGQQERFARQRICP